MEDGGVNITVTYRLLAAPVGPNCKVSFAFYLFQFFACKKLMHHKLNLRPCGNLVSITLIEKYGPIIKRFVLDSCVYISLYPWALLIIWNFGMKKIKIHFLSLLKLRFNSKFPAWNSNLDRSLLCIWSSNQEKVNFFFKHHLFSTRSNLWKKMCMSIWQIIIKYQGWGERGGKGGHAPPL